MLVDTNPTRCPTLHGLVTKNVKSRAVHRLVPVTVMLCIYIIFVFITFSNYKSLALFLKFDKVNFPCNVFLFILQRNRNNYPRLLTFRFTIRMVDLRCHAHYFLGCSAHFSGFEVATSTLLLPYMRGKLKLKMYKEFSPLISQCVSLVMFVHSK